MKKPYIRRLNDKEEEIADTLITLGMNMPVARTLAYLQNLNEATSLELERCTGLTQPEISLAMQQLKEHDWINERERRRTLGKEDRIRFIH